MSDEMKSTRPSLADELSLDQQHPNIRSDVRSGARVETGTQAPPARHMLGEAAAALGGAVIQRKLAQRWVQRRANGEAGQEDPAQIHAAAERGLSGGSQALPHLETIQRAFGGHDVGGVQAHVGGAASEASAAMSASAYAVGNSVAFAQAPDLHTAAHEAAHVVQQRGGVSLQSGVGQEGDSYERNADAVADRVVAGKSAADLLPSTAGAASA